MQALAAGGRHEIRTVRVRDRFGDYGLVGLVIAERGDEALEPRHVPPELPRARPRRRAPDRGRPRPHGARRPARSAVKLRVETTKRNTPARSFLESVVPAELRQRRRARASSADVPADVLAARPLRAGDVPARWSSRTTAAAKAAAQPVDAAQLRRREEQIARAAFELATGAAHARRGRGPHAPQPRPPAAGAGAADVAGVVHEAFAAALRVPVEQVAQVDRLEALGCDSLRIVEITVALSERFPWLPSTLLFEHRSVSQHRRRRSCGCRSRRPRAAVGGRGRARRAAGTRPAPSPTSPSSACGVRCAGASSPDELWELLQRRPQRGRAGAGRPPALPAPARRLAAALGRAARRRRPVRCRVLRRLAARSRVHGPAAAAVPRGGLGRARGRRRRRARRTSPTPACSPA